MNIYVEIKGEEFFIHIFKFKVSVAKVYFSFW